MFRFLFLVLLCYSIGSGMRDGWLIIKWSRFFHSIGFTKVDPNKPMNWSDFIINNIDKDSLIKSEDNSFIE